MPTQFTNAINAIPDKYVMQEKQFGLITAGATLPIYAGGKIRTANKAAEVKVNQAKEKSDEQTASLITELTTRYFGLSLAEDVIAVRQEVLDGMVNAIYVLGLVTKIFNFPNRGEFISVALFILPLLLSVIFLAMGLSSIYKNREHSMAY